MASGGPSFSRCGKSFQQLRTGHVQQLARLVPLADAVMAAAWQQQSCGNSHQDDSQHERNNIGAGDGFRRVCIRRVFRRFYGCHDAWGSYDFRRPPVLRTYFSLPLSAVFPGVQVGQIPIPADMPCPAISFETCNHENNNTTAIGRGSAGNQWMHIPPQHLTIGEADCAGGDHHHRTRRPDGRDDAAGGLPVTHVSRDDLLLPWKHVLPCQSVGRLRRDNPSLVTSVEAFPHARCTRRAIPFHEDTTLGRFGCGSCAWSVFTPAG